MQVGAPAGERFSHKIFKKTEFRRCHFRFPANEIYGVKDFVRVERKHGRSRTLLSPSSGKSNMRPQETCSGFKLVSRDPFLHLYWKTFRFCEVCDRETVTQVDNSHKPYSVVRAIQNS